MIRERSEHVFIFQMTFKTLPLYCKLVGCGDDVIEYAKYYPRFNNNKSNNNYPLLPACNCNEAGTTSEICASITEDDVEAGTCICKANVERSAKCDTCKAEHYGLSAENPLGCTGT